MRATLLLVLASFIAAPVAAAPRKPSSPRQPLAADLAATRAAMQAYRAKHEVVVPSRGTGNHPTLALLGEYRALYARSEDDYERHDEPLLLARESGKSGAEQAIGITDTGKLHVGWANNRASWTGTKLAGTYGTGDIHVVEDHDPPSPEQLKSFGLSSLSALETAANRALLKIAKLPASRSNPAQIKAARAQVERELAVGRELRALATGAEQSEDLELLMAVHDARVDRGETKGTLTLATIPATRQQARRTLSPKYDDRGVLRIAVLHHPSDGSEPASHWAGAIDLRDFGIHSAKAFHQMVERAMGELAPEDL